MNSRDAYGSVLSEFDEKEDQAIQKAMDTQSSEDQRKIDLKYPGRYLMEVSTFAWEDKDKGVIRTSPEISITKNKSLMININLKVIDGTDVVPKGASIYTNIVIRPAKGASEETIEKTIRMAKPRLVALTGNENISMKVSDIVDSFVPQYEMKDGKLILIKDHKMKQRVYVTTETDYYQGEKKQNVESIVKAVEGDKSISEPIETKEEKPISGTSSNPSPADLSSIPEIDTTKMSPIASNVDDFNA